MKIKLTSNLAALRRDAHAALDKHARRRQDEAVGDLGPLYAAKAAEATRVHARRGSTPAINAEAKRTGKSRKEIAEAIEAKAGELQEKLSTVAAEREDHKQAIEAEKSPRALRKMIDDFDPRPASVRSKHGVVI